ncbi:uncharacterized protein LOC113563742 [Drosophila erecta]|uniref:uncharacterized protein LOC113563742 n=1 Tax=Drosophila erecta TaxID=7220 RepID=UPI000F06A0E3|nr:uncharacterized protein LOC113563742 [Drosophila erecta]
MEPYPNGFLSFTIENHLASQDVPMEDGLRQGAECWNALSSREKRHCRSKYQNRYLTKSSTTRHRRHTEELKCAGRCRRTIVPKCSRKPPSCKARRPMRCPRKCSSMRSARKCMLIKSPEGYYYALSTT